MLNPLIDAVGVSETLAIGAIAAERQAKGLPVFKLSTGEPDFNTPAHILAAMTEAGKQGKTKYTAVNGIPELRQALTLKLRTKNQIETEAAEVVITNGGKQAIAETLRACLCPGDEVIIFAPYWVSYVDQVRLVGATPVVINTKPESGWKVSPELLAAAYTAKTKMLIINSPSNPTGLVYSKSELRGLGAVVADHPLSFVLSDEVYEDLIFSEATFTSWAGANPGLADRTITVSSFSKTYSMTGLRIGYVTGSKAVINNLTKIMSQTTSNVCSMMQAGALAALQGSQEFLSDWVNSFERRRNLALDRVRGIAGFSVSHKPAGAFYLFIEVNPRMLAAVRPAWQNVKIFCEDLLNERGVAVVPGASFGYDAAFRISVATNEQVINQAFDEIEQFVKK